MDETDQSLPRDRQGELPWIIPRTQLEAMDADQLREVVIDMHEKVGRLMGAIKELGADNPQINVILNPSQASPDAPPDTKS